MLVSVELVLDSMTPGHDFVQNKATGHAKTSWFSFEFCPKSTASWPFDYKRPPFGFRVGSNQTGQTLRVLIDQNRLGGLTY